jgi:recombination protein RecR
MDYPPCVRHLIEKLTGLPGVGRRSAERIALHLLKSPPERSRELSEAILAARSAVRNCALCGGYSDRELCGICSDERRTKNILCIVEQPNDVLVLEKAGGFRGRYHVLMGKLSPLNGVGPEHLRIAPLLKRISTESISEVILALGADVEGEATAMYLAKEIAPLNVAVTRIAQGIPIGASLESADEVTIARAMEGRRKL